MYDVYFDKLENGFNINEMLDNFTYYEDDVIYLSGSLVEGQMCKYSEGMGNKKSDVDVFILRNKKHMESKSYTYNELIKRIFFFTHNNINFDVEVFDKEVIEQIISSLNDVNLDINTKTLNLINLPRGWDIENLNSFIKRIKYSTCIFNKGDYKKIINNIDQDKFAKIFIRYLINDIDQYYDDALENMERDTIDTSLYVTRKMIYLMLNTVLYRNGSYTDKFKWIGLKFKNLVKYEKKYQYLFDVYNLCIKSDVSDYDTAIKAINKTLSAINETINELDEEGL